MKGGLYSYPQNAFFGRVVPKKKIYEHAAVSASIRQKIVDGIDKIVWQYKLAPETINLPCTAEVPEIDVFTISLKHEELHEAALRAIDNAIPRPVIYELNYQDRVKAKTAYKRPSEADGSKWVTELYFESDWVSSAAERETLPVALDLGVLYERIIRELSGEAPSKMVGDLRKFVATTARGRALADQILKLESDIAKEKQFNRKVELNQRLRGLRQELAAL